ncbi:MAG: GMC family oxidoreductase [Myxococcota bacterium]
MSVSRAAEPTDDPEAVRWDAIVIGAGMGGATAGFELARLGRRVLFLEKGRFVQREGDTVRGDLGDQIGNPEERVRRGYWPQPLAGLMGVRAPDARERRSHPIHALKGGEVEFFGPLGCGTGGSTILYGATLERFFPSDFAPRANFPEVADSTLPERWPISYAELEPFYRRAERIFRVRGTPDPMHPSASDPLPEPAELNAQDRDVFELFVRKGLHPYRIHIGCRFVEGCDGCAGRVCLRDCKSDAGRVCVIPAVDQHGARLLTECEVTRLEADRARVTRVHARWRGRELALEARMVIAAAGALMTPVLLLNSTAEHWPNGLANGSGLVGRNLMVHTGDMIAVRSGVGRTGTGFNKSLSINDLYVARGRKLGNFQSVGVQVDTGSVLAHVQTTLAKGPRWLRRLAHPLLLRVIARIGAWYFRNSVIFGSIVEDLPYLENRVLPDPRSPNGMRFEYRYPPELAERNALFRSELARRLGRTRVVTLTRPMNLNFGHLCGTARFGDDPGASVLDRNNRAHEVENLYVVDGSFFPSSGGTNPSLTIAANALRVAEAIHAELARGANERAAESR